MPIKITEELKEYLLDQPHVKKIHFTADGSSSAHAYKKGDKLYARLLDAGTLPTDEEQNVFEVVATLTREQILGVSAVKSAPQESDEKEGADGSEASEGTEVE